jgi:integrase
MASIRQKPGSPYWYACLTLPHARTERSTRIRCADGVQARRRAQALADLWERDLLDQREAQRAHAVVDELIGKLHGSSAVLTVPAYLDQWLAAREGELAPGTYRVYEKRLREFGRSARTLTLSQLSSEHVRKFRDDLAKRVGTSTVNKYLSTIKTVLQDAVRDGHLVSNPCDALRRLKAKRADTRRAFTLDELRRVHELASPEWQSMILFGLYTGQRLQDIAALTWASLDLVTQEARFVTGKGNKRMVVPLHPCLMDHIQAMQTPSDPNAPLHPGACAVVAKTGRVSTLSNAFRDILASAGLVRARYAKTNREGDRRQQSELSFHSLRHTATTLLKQAGISGPVVQELIGHESDAVNRVYTHIDAETLRAANASLPRL